MGRNLHGTRQAAAVSILLLATAVLASGNAPALDGHDVVAFWHSHHGLADDHSSPRPPNRQQGVEILGPVTLLQPLTVLGQRIQVGKETVWVDGASADSLHLGHEVEVHGLYDGRVLRATRIERKPKGHQEWKLTGYVTHLHRSGVDVGYQLVAVGSKTRIRDCLGSQPRVGQWVEVRAVPRAEFHPGDPIMASRLECKS